MPTLFKTCVICNNSCDRFGNQYRAEGGESCTHSQTLLVDLYVQL